MTITRTTLLSGPAAVSFAGRTFWARDGILISPALEIAAVGSDANGVLDGSVSQVPVTIRFVPSAPTADLVVLLPHLQGAPGESLFGAADVPLVLTAANGVRLTFAAVAITQMPDLLLGTRGAAAGTMTFLALGARTQAATAPSRVVAIDTATMPAEPTATPQLSDDYVLSWGGWTLRSREGFRVRFSLETTPVLSDANALLDLTLARLAVEVRCVPASPGGPDEADVLAALQVQGVPAGRLLSGGAGLLVIAGEALTVTLPLAQMVSGELAFAGTRARLGEMVWVAERALVETAAALAEVGD